MVSAFEGNEQITMAENSGVDFYVTKPATKSKIDSALSKFYIF